MFSHTVHNLELVGQLARVSERNIEPEGRQLVEPRVQPLRGYTLG